MIRPILASPLSPGPLPTNAHVRCVRGTSAESGTGGFVPMYGTVSGLSAMLVHPLTLFTMMHLAGALTARRPGNAAAAANTSPAAASLHLPALPRHANRLSSPERTSRFTRSEAAHLGARGLYLPGGKRYLAASNCLLQAIVIAVAIAPPGLPSPTSAPPPFPPPSPPPTTPPIMSPPLVSTIPPSRAPSIPVPPPSASRQPDSPASPPSTPPAAAAASHSTRSASLPSPPASSRSARPRRRRHSPSCFEAAAAAAPPPPPTKGTQGLGAPRQRLLASATIVAGISAGRDARMAGGASEDDSPLGADRGTRLPGAKVTAPPSFTARAGGVSRSPRSASPTATTCRSLFVSPNVPPSSSRPDVSPSSPTSSAAAE
mmetsp:Transcript_36783/g.59066  ORF Transcript_36783/g.59066 Transcript_36783/m.59066 type:complete len:374 (-) Transcript_36783:1069-2190(-)